MHLYGTKDYVLLSLQAKGQKGEAGDVTFGPVSSIHACFLAQILILPPPHYIQTGPPGVVGQDGRQVPTHSPVAIFTLSFISMYRVHVVHLVCPVFQERKDQGLASFISLAVLYNMQTM